MNTLCITCIMEHQTAEGISYTCSRHCPQYRTKRTLDVDARRINRVRLMYTYCYSRKGKIVHESFTGTQEQMERRWWALQTLVLGYDYFKCETKPIKRLTRRNKRMTVETKKLHWSMWKQPIGNFKRLTNNEPAVCIQERTMMSNGFTAYEEPCPNVAECTALAKECPLVILPVAYNKKEVK